MNWLIFSLGALVGFVLSPVISALVDVVKALADRLAEHK